MTNWHKEENIPPSYHDEIMLEPSAEDREPQINCTVCGRRCGVRGFIDGEDMANAVCNGCRCRCDCSKHGSDADRVYIEADEGVHDHGPFEFAAPVPSPPVHATFSSILTTYADYDHHDRHGFTLGEEHIVHQHPFRAETPRDPLHRVDSGDSMAMHFNSSTEPSVMSSSGFLSMHPGSPDPLMGVGGAWDSSIRYFFTRTPLPLNEPPRCCHAETETEDDSSDTLYDSSDVSEDADEEDSSN